MGLEGAGASLSVPGGRWVVEGWRGGVLTEFGWGPGPDCWRRQAHTRGDGRSGTVREGPFEGTFGSIFVYG